MSALRTWFAGRTVRERRLILVMLGLAAVTLVWGAIILPVRDGLSSSRARYTDAVVRLGEAQAAVVRMKAIQRRGATPLAGALADVVRASADGAGLVLASVDAEASDRVRAGVASARAGALTAWIAQLEASGVLVDALTVAANGDGSVNAQMTLVRAGA